MPRIANLAATAATAAAITLGGATSEASEARTVAKTFTGACLKTSDRGCTAWVRMTLEARPGFAFVVSGADVTLLEAQNAKVARPTPGLAVYGGLQVVKTAIGPVKVAQSVTEIGEIQSGGGFAGIGTTSSGTFRLELTEIPLR